MTEVTALLEIYEILARHHYLSSINHKTLLLGHDVCGAWSNASPTSKSNRKYAVLLYDSIGLTALTTHQNSGIVTFMTRVSSAGWRWQSSEKPETSHLFKPFSAWVHHSALLACFLTLKGNRKNLHMKSKVFCTKVFVWEAWVWTGLRLYS